MKDYFFFVIKDWSLFISSSKVGQYDRNRLTTVKVL